ncbi:MAG: hypothetical protein HRT90_11235, partial [Candidatus Margulisbacteria bacterium]|nr:hypothetical protein [Candidatus Margulisiibacteriota bacterium]
EKVLREKIEQFRSEVFDIIKKDQNPEILLQLSMMYFPKSHYEIKKEENIEENIEEKK